MNQSIITINQSVNQLKDSALSASLPLNRAGLAIQVNKIR